MIPPGMEQLQMPKPPVPPPPPPPASPSLPHLLHQQPPQLASQISPHQQTAHLQPQMPPPQFSFGEPPAPAPYDFHQQAPYEFQQPQPQEYQHSQPSQFNMAQDVPEAGAYGGLPHPQSWAPQMPYPPNNVGPGIGAGPGMGHQFEYEFVHPGHQHPQHLQGHTMFPRPPHGPGFRPGGPPIGHFGYNPALGPGAGAGMDFSMFVDNGHGHNVGPERPKKASVPNWLKEELLKKKAAVAGGAQLTGTEDNPRANGDNIEASTHNKFELSDRSRSDVSRMSDSEDDDEEDDTEAARTAAMNQEIKRVLTEVLLKVTDDLFDEIAQEVMDEDEQRLLEDPTKKALLAEELGGAKAKLFTHASALAPAPAHASAPVRVLVAPVVKRSQVDSDDDSESLSSGAPAGNLLGLASYASDDEDAGRNSRQLTEAEHVNGGNSDTEASELKSLAAVKGEKVKHVDTEDEVAATKEVKGKKRLSEEALNSDNSGRSPRRARHTEVSGDEAGQKELAASLKSGVTVNQVKSGAVASQKPDSGVAGEDKLNHNISSTERRKLEDGHDHLSKRRSADDSLQLRRVDKETVSSGKREHGVETDSKKSVRDKDHSNAKQGVMEADGDGDHKNGIKRDKDSSRDENDRVRENKERGRDRESLRSKERDHNVQKIKERERESDLAREKDKDRGKSSKARGRDSDRERRKSTSEKYDRKSSEHKKDKEKSSKRAHRKRTSSLSSRSRSRSRSESSSASGSRSSSPSPVRSGTPKRGKQRRGRSSKKSSHASPPSRSRRRTSRSPSRSVPHSKVSHRRHSPSLSREKERNRKSRSASPAPKRRRS
ncbi:hypothetical protein KC19_11G089700 [Ceratodon purpureus]|nr:hypothetical protein KC19_11G089700 [Ceratodon purpureus]